MKKTQVIYKAQWKWWENLIAQLCLFFSLTGGRELCPNKVERKGHCLIKVEKKTDFMDVLYFKDNYNVLSEINNSIRISKLNNLQLGSILEAA